MISRAKIIFPYRFFTFLTIKYANFIKIVLSIIISLSSIYAQTLSGRVKDKDNGNPLVNCNIVLLGTNRGTITNEDGSYSIYLGEQGQYTLLFKYIGYKTDTLKITMEGRDVKRDIFLTSQIFTSDDIVIFANLYSEAEELILRASQKKKKYLSQLKNYSCKSYTKSTIFLEKKPNNIKYVLLLEFYSRVFWNVPDYYYEIIESQKQSSNIPQSINIFSGNAFLDINSDKIHINKKIIIGPLAEEAIRFYHYEIVDTLFQDNDRIFKMRITPKDNFRPSMSGYIFLVDKIFILQKIDVKLNQQCNYGFYQNIHLVQQYAKDHSKMYLPYYSLNEGDWIVNIPQYPKLKYKKENFREDYEINKPANTKYSGQSKIVFENEMPFEEIPMNIPPLTTEERKGYSQIDSIVTNRPAVNFVTKGIKFIDYYSQIKKQPVGDFSDFYRFNKTEGNFIGLAFDTKSFIEPIHLSGGYGKGLSDNKDKFFINLGYNYVAPVFNIGFVLRRFNTITTREEITELPIWYNSFTSLLSSYDYFDYYYTNGRSFTFKVDFSPFSFHTSLFSESHTNSKRNKRRGLLGSKDFLPALLIVEGKYAGFSIMLKYSTAAFRLSPLSKEVVKNQAYTEISYMYERALKNWGSNSNYGRQRLLATFHMNTFYSGFLDFQLYLCTGSPNLPIQKYFELESGTSLFERFRTFRTLSLNAFTGNKKIAVYFEHNFHNAIFRLSHLPYIENISLNLTFIYNWGWAGNLDWDNLQIKHFYSETGFAIGPLFSLIKAEFLWSLQKNNIGKDFAFLIKIGDIEL